MGRGDKKTKRGKIAMGSSGRLRPRSRKLKAKPETMAEKETDEKVK